ncbi:MAG: hypothetical protein LAP38_10655 [Acidobacteriia bacterium]|nr:hypothetical protein [Terriglobia bacterium]
MPACQGAGTQRVTNVGVLCVYRDGFYRPDGEMLIPQRVKHLLLDYDCSEMVRQC